MEIRRGAPLEAPHIMLLVNDPEKTLVEGTGARVRSSKALYDTRLEPDAGSLAGWEVSSPDDLDYVARAVTGPCGGEYRGPTASTFLFAVGDGNHSLATAKAVWDEFRAAHAADAKAGKSILRTIPRASPSSRSSISTTTASPSSRFTACSSGPRQRPFPSFLASRLGGTVSACASPAVLERAVGEKNETRFGFVDQGSLSILDTPNPALAVSRLQPALDEFLAQTPGVTIDYIHGAEEVWRLGKEPGAVFDPPSPPSKRIASSER